MLTANDKQITAPSILGGVNIKITRKNKCPFKRGRIDMKFTMTGQEKSDLLIQVTA
jgi:hypothetical protein